MKRTLKQLTTMIAVENEVSPFDEVVVNGVSIDSRRILKGNLFVPLQGERVDGHQFVRKAIESGASAALWQENVPNPPEGFPILIVKDTLVALQELSRSYRNELNLKVVGITGSNGKTTTKDMTSCLLETHFKVQKTEGNYNNHIGLPLTILSLEEDTDIAVIEMGMSGLGEISFLSQIARPDVAIITNIGEAHLLDLGSREKIAEAKLEIIDGLKEDGLLIYNGDEPLLFNKINGKAISFHQQTFGQKEANGIYPISIKLYNHGSAFRVNDSDKEFHLPVLGTHNVMNALAAIACARFFEIPYEKIDQAFSNLRITTMRMEMVKGVNGATIINDAYNASPTSMKAAIQLLTHLEGFKKKMVVLGDMLELGEQEENFHLEIGKEINQQEIDFVFTYGRLGAFIAQGAKYSFPENKVYSFTDKEELAHHLKELLDSDTIVLVKASRGMKLETVVEALRQE